MSIPSKIEGYNETINNSQLYIIYNTERERERERESEDYFFLLTHIFQ